MALDALGSTPRLIHPTPAILAISLDDPLIDDPTDNLILASILRSCADHPSEAKVFLTENRKDFDHESVPRSLPSRRPASDISPTPSKFLEWHRAQPEVIEWPIGRRPDDPGGVEGRPWRTAARPISTPWNAG